MLADKTDRISQQWMVGKGQRKRHTNLIALRGFGISFEMKDARYSRPGSHKIFAIFFRIV